MIATGAGTGLTNAFYISSIPGVSPGSTYTLSFWAKKLNGADTFTARLSGGGLEVEADANAVAANDWRFVSIVDQASSNTLYMYSEGPGEWLVDNISITEGASAGGSTLAYYRFEEGSGTDIVNSVNGIAEGTFQGGGFSSDTPGLPGGASNNFSGDFLTAGWGFTMETATAGIRIILSGVLEKYPGTKLIMGHLGETLPFLLWRIDLALNRRGAAGVPFRKLFTKHFHVTTSGFFSAPA